MTINTSPEGVATFRVEGLPTKFRTRLEPVFGDRIRNLSCLASARLNFTTYSLYIQGLCSKSLKKEGTVMALCYRLQLDIEADTIGEEVYYYGYGCDIPAEYRPFGGTPNDSGTSIFYSGDTVINTLLIDLSGSIPADEIGRISTLTGIGAIPEHADFIRVRFQENVLIDAAYHHRGGALVTAN